jgi:hypothetical protein
MKFTAALALLLSLAPAAAFVAPSSRRAGALRPASVAVAAEAVAPVAPRDPLTVPRFADYGKHQFAGGIADGYLRKQGLSAETLKDPTWVVDRADGVAAAVLEW